MTTSLPYRLEEAVASIYPDIAQRVTSQRPNCDERQLWWELSCCLLSSQVPFPLATAAASAIDKSKILLTESTDSVELAFELTNILGSGLTVEGQQRRYRFPKVRALHLAQTRAAVTQETGSLVALLENLKNPLEAREWFVKHAHGVGPKQASMFLRNAGISYDLAILDRHVLRYMESIGIVHESRTFISGLNRYRQWEIRLSLYAERMGFAVGLLDWAIWIVMRMARDVQPETNMEFEFL
jgi:N-glycosylase/DNA lyase